MKKAFITIILFISTISVAKTQFLDEYFVGIGISTTKLLGDNPNTYEIINPNTNIYGGSYDKWQPGIDLRLLFNLNESKSLRLPIGIDYAIFNSYKRYNYGMQTRVFNQSLNILNFYTGINIALVKFPVADARLYASLEPRFSLVHLISMEEYIDYNDPSVKDIVEEYPTKDEAFRIGGVFKIGVEGRLKDNIYVNGSFGISTINLLLRDDERGELFTPNRANQDSEEFVGAMNVTVMLQYKFN